MKQCIEIARDAPAARRPRGHRPRRATVAALKPELRWFSTVRQSLPRSGANSLYDRLGSWCRGGELGWVFDMADDRLGDLRSHMAIGFDYTEFLSSPTCARRS